MNIRLVIAFACFGLVSACGIRGPLEPAAPMWGPDRAAYEAEQARKAEEARQKKAEEDAAKQAETAPAAPTRPPQ
ncbi:hypothetical protein PbB2_01341 [Candidatus Phycosocius bacilliformis]|jgi:hypothetical protein|uniref:Lipoprotein n=1 Tax=Candidatus Phycosocius bacilliformis TaxID=1445552 RepID=A0A2P2E9D8_9PROT|nr:argininosuccinate lyase [Candidatus Phycosocius bacilliformis]GBF57672.1 hypothetical protein PbB2_01341 [Candidatus Phycosocius bacilliformis]